MITDTTDMQRVKGVIQEQLHERKLDDIKEMCIIREMHHLLRLNHEETENISKPKSSEQIDSVMKTSR